MLAKKCDRCGAFYEEREPNALETLADSLKGMLQATKPTPMPRLNNDLCRECRKSFDKWWKCTEDEK